MVEQSTVRIFDDGVLTERRPAEDEEVDWLSVAIGRRIPAEMPVQPCGRHNSICLFVQKDMDNRPISDTHRSFLFAEWQQQILANPQSRNAPTLRFTLMTFKYANSPTVASGVSMMATRRSSESR